MHGEEFRMTLSVETALRGPEAYSLSRRVIDEMESVGVWPTPLNFELWLHYLGDPEGALGREIQRILANTTLDIDFTTFGSKGPKLATADKKLQAIASVSGNIAINVSYHSEA